LIKYLIIEKDRSTIDRINFVLTEYINFRSIGSIENYDEAMNKILKETPDLVFLNIDKVLKDPFQFIQELNQFNECNLEFIAISSSKNDAYTALKNGFLDFLLIPLTELDIRKSVLKFQKKRKVRKLSTICIRSYKDYQYLKTNNIIFLKADNNTTDFFLKNNRTVNAYKTLKTYEELLPNNFLRIHKSYIVNSNHVSRINYGKSICFVNEENKQIPFSKTYLEKVRNMNDVLNQSTIHSFAQILN